MQYFLRTPEKYVAFFLNAISGEVQSSSIKKYIYIGQHVIRIPHILLVIVVNVSVFSIKMIFLFCTFKGSAKKIPGSFLLPRFEPKVNGIYSELRPFWHPVLWKSVQQFFYNPADKPTNQQAQVKIANHAKTLNWCGTVNVKFGFHMWNFCSECLSLLILA